MHTFKAEDSIAHKETIFHYNGDLSGNVTIIRDGIETQIPGNHLLQFLANYIRGEMIVRLEEASDEAILGIDPW